MGVGVLDLSTTTARNFADVFLRTWLILYLAMLATESAWALFRFGDSQRVQWLPGLGVSAYPATVLIYAVVGFYLIRRLGWTAALVLGWMALFQEGTWNPLYYSLYPWYASYAMGVWGYWLDYVVLLIVSVPVLAVLTHRYLAVKWLGPWSWLSITVVYLVIVLYYGNGMPTISFTPGTLRAVNGLPETSYVLASVCAIIGTFKFYKKGKV
jgi:hypothetical protein